MEAWLLLGELQPEGQMEKPWGAAEVEVLVGMGWYSKRVGSSVEGSLVPLVLELEPEVGWLIANF